MSIRLPPNARVAILFGPVAHMARSDMRLDGWPALRTTLRRSLLPDFQRIFPNEEACIAYLFASHFPHGFICPTCGDTQEPYRFTARPTTRRCRANQRHEVSLTANTVMHRTKVPICTWFYAAFLITSLTPGMSVLQLQKMLGIKRYETAFNMLHKLRAAMVRPGRDSTGQQRPVEVDETFVGGATQGEGHGRHHKTLVVGAVEVMARTDVKWKGRDPNVPRGQHRGGHGRGVVAGRLRFQVVPDRKQETLMPFVQANIAPGAEVRTAGSDMLLWRRSATATCQSPFGATTPRQMCISR